MVFVIGLLLLITGVLLLLRNQRNNQQKEDVLLIDFQYRIMIYLLIGAGIVLLIRELKLLFF
jgi:uncharacterized membrane protein HdeD (DUF308 family)